MTIDTQALQQTNFYDATYAQNAYEAGFKGALYSPKAMQNLRDAISASGGIPSGTDAIKEYGLSYTGEGKLSLPYISVQGVYPECYPGAAQTVGDCVSQSTSRAIWASFVCEILHGTNEGKSELPKISPEGIRNGCVSSEAIYWYRGYNGDGWFCAESAEVALQKCGLVLRQDYPELGIDLTEYSGQKAHLYGSKAPPESVQAVTKMHLTATSTVCTDYESCRDMLQNGYCITSCGNEAFVNERDQYGIANRSRQSWAHAMVVIACDDRRETVEREGCGLLLICNSWGKNWISGNRKIYGTEYEIPDGTFWARWSDVSNRYFAAMSSSKGWPAKKMPNWGLEGII